MSNDGFGPNPNVPTPTNAGSSSTLKWVIGIIAGLGLLVLLCCGGCLLVGKFGLDQVGNQVAQEVQSDPVIMERIGNVEAVKMELIATSERQQETGDYDAMVFSITGDKGSGKLYGTKTGPDQMGNFVLEQDGVEYPLSE